MKEIIEVFKREIGEEVSSIEYFSGGTNDNYLINHKYIFRRKKKVVDRYYDGELEKEIEDKLLHQDITIPCLYFDPVKGIKITPFYKDGLSLNKIKLSKKNVISMAEKLKEFHSKKIKVSKNFLLFERLRYYKEEARVEKYEYHDQIIRNIMKYYEDADMVLCHNNLKIHNIMKDGNSYYLMDFEDGGNNVIYFDIFSIFSSYEISKKNKDIFLTTYFGGKLPKNISQIRDDFCALIDLYNFYWNVMMYRVTLEFSYSHTAEECLQRLNSFFYH